MYQETLAEDFVTIPTSLEGVNSTDTRNVADEFKGMPISKIREILLGRSLPFAVLFENVQGDLNLGVVLRTSNAFGARRVFWTGRKRFDRRSTVGVHHYTDFEYIPNLEDIQKLKEEYYFICFENNHPESMPLPQLNWHNTQGKIPLLIFGSEEAGVNPQIKAMCDAFVYIEQRGSVRSLNVSSCASIAIFLASQALGG